MIVQLAPVEKNVPESICRLNFAQRVRTVEVGQASKKMESGDLEVCYLM
jgi:kinesin family protein C2/C3